MKQKLLKMGLKEYEYSQLRTQAIALRRWFTYYSNHVSHDEENNKFYHYDRKSGKRTEIKDMQPFHTNIVRHILSKPKHKNLGFYIQEDCRGESLYIYEKQEVGDMDIESCYGSFGVPVTP